MTLQCLGKNVPFNESYVKKTEENEEEMKEGHFIENKYNSLDRPC